ncbi:hypothetical protein CLV59_105266 [Chitinophaga dinghuensis]|uniref:Lasso RiPP family leader peptide-containing protein n=1 Tax=Chitinophaga dinghuensis TaxID=1539050 RepID=A0A327W596_9BACT|nr:hypothetical protein CLV59_105266 [Chitinophaga dinghuensis]
MNATNQVTQKVYKSPELKELGKLGEITNTTRSSGRQNDGGTGPNYFS